MKLKWNDGSYGKETICYLLFGVLTVIINVIAFLCLDLILNELVANTIAFFISVLFAYWTNTLFVFRRTISWKSFFAFFAMRGGTLLIDDGGMYLMIEWGCNKFLAKCILNGIVIILNYLFSKFIIYKNKSE